MSRKQAEIYAYILSGIWMILKLLTFIITPLLNPLRWVLHILLLAACFFFGLSLYLAPKSRTSKKRHS